MRAAAEGGSAAPVLLLGDNMAVCLAFERRRAASFGLLRFIRCLASICLANKLRTSVRWVPSERNAAGHSPGHCHGEHHQTTHATSDSITQEPVSKRTIGRTLPQTRFYQHMKRSRTPAKSEASDGKILHSVF